MTEAKHKRSTDSAPKGGAASPSKRETVANNQTGRVRHDDRGNAIWEWAVQTGGFIGDAVSQRIKKLDNLSLSIAEDAPPAYESFKKNPLGTVKGYSPYDSGVLEKKSTAKRRDLRKLSEWLKLKKQHEELKKSEK